MDTVVPSTAIFISLETCAGVNPKAIARWRSIRICTSGLPSSREELTLRVPGTFSTMSTTCLESVRSVSRSSPRMLRATAPPLPIDIPLLAVTVVLAPEISLSDCRISSATCSAPFRSLLGTNCTMKEASFDPDIEAVAPELPTLAYMISTAGFFDSLVSTWAASLSTSSSLEPLSASKVMSICPESDLGINSAPTRGDIPRAKTIRTTTLSMTRRRWPKVQASHILYFSPKPSSQSARRWNCPLTKPLPASCLSMALSVSMREDIKGTTVRDTSREQAMATHMVSASGLNRTPLIPPVRPMGRNTAIKVKVLARTAPPTSLVPFKAASRAGRPRLRWR